MEGTSRILSLGIGVGDVLLRQNLPGDAEDRMRYAKGGSTRGWNEGKRGEVNAKGDKRPRGNPKNGSHRLKRIGRTLSFNSALWSAWPRANCTAGSVSPPAKAGKGNVCSVECERAGRGLEGKANRQAIDMRIIMGRGGV